MTCRRVTTAMSSATSQSAQSNGEAYAPSIRLRATKSRRLLTLLISDLVDSTPTAAKVGDSVWRDMLSAHYEMGRTQLERFDGRKVKTTGDGMRVTFGPGSCPLSRPGTCNSSSCSTLRLRRIPPGWRAPAPPRQSASTQVSLCRRAPPRARCRDTRARCDSRRRRLLSGQVHGAISSTVDATTSVALWKRQSDARTSTSLRRIGALGLRTRCEAMTPGIRAATATKTQSTPGHRTRARRA